MAQFGEREREPGSVTLEKMVSVHLQAAGLKKSLLVIMIEQEQFLCRKRCARRKLAETDTERCMGRDELGRRVWHAVANGGS